MNTPLASIIVPIYNVEAYLPPCVESIQGQTYSNLEMILVDDGSADGSGQLCDSFAEQDPRIRVIHQKNSGVSAARNAGLDIARGKYIYFVDGDDWIAPCMVEETLSLMEREGCDAWTWGHNIVAENGETAYSGRRKEKRFRFPTTEKRQRFLCRWLLSYRLDWSVWSQVFRRDLVEHRGLRFAVEQKIGEDLDFSFRYLAGCKNLYYIPKPFYFYRRREHSAMYSADLAELAADTLRMVRRQDRTLTDHALPRPFYVCGGTMLTMYLGHLKGSRPPEEVLAQAAAYFQAPEDYDYLLDQARLASRNRFRIRQICGLRMGEQVNGFFHYILTGDASAYIRAERLQQLFLSLRGLKDRLLYRRKG